MTLTKTLPYFETEDAQILGLPYQSREVFMFIVLPTERNGLKGLIEKLDGNTLIQWIKNAHDFDERKRDGPRGNVCYFSLI